MMITTYILAGIIVVQSVLHHIERRDLYTRLMCRDARDYKDVTDNAKLQPPISRHREVLNRWRGKGGGRE